MHPSGKIFISNSWVGRERRKKTLSAGKLRKCGCPVAHTCMQSKKKNKRIKKHKQEMMEEPSNSCDSLRVTAQGALYFNIDAESAE